MNISIANMNYWIHVCYKVCYYQGCSMMRSGTLSVILNIVIWKKQVNILMMTIIFIVVYYWSPQKPQSVVLISWGCVEMGTLGLQISRDLQRHFFIVPTVRTNHVALYDFLKCNNKLKIRVEKRNIWEGSGFGLNDQPREIFSGSGVLF